MEIRRAVHARTVLRRFPRQFRMYTAVLQVQEARRYNHGWRNWKLVTISVHSNRRFSPDEVVSFMAGIRETGNWSQLDSTQTEPFLLTKFRVFKFLERVRMGG